MDAEEKRAFCRGVMWISDKSCQRNFGTTVLAWHELHDRVPEVTRCQVTIFFFLNPKFIVHCLHNKTLQCYKEHYIRDPGYGR